ncbi:MAG: hypothetical protein M3O35_19665 [Acidobacteriota bacterium]|nr:hypothetical protein [Acidobacteriota bacterium]
MHKLFIAAVLLAASFQLAQAGPPLICHAYDIGTAASLPWGGGGSGWDNPDTKYDVKRLAADTLALLDSKSPVLVRMETMRRAVIYGANNHDQARALLSGLRGRAANGGSALANFDYGYMLASFNQMTWRYKEDLTGGVDGYEFVTKALAIQPDSAEMHFAAAIMASSPPRPADREEHLRKARAASGDALLARNVASHF